MPLPPRPARDEVFVHDVLLDEAAGYTPRPRTLAGGPDVARAVHLGLEPGEDGVLKVKRMSGWAAYPHLPAISGVFTLRPRETGRYRANLRLGTTCCSPQWFYESWHILVGNGPALTEPTHHVDRRTHLYGG